MSKKKHERRQVQKQHKKIFILISVIILVFSGVIFSVYHFVLANSAEEPNTILVQIDPNIGVRAQVEEFFTDNNALEMIPIIKCESEFKHYNLNGSALKNRSGSSAIGVAQILASKHPDPKILSLYNKRFNVNLTEKNIDITTLEGNLGYALMLYELHGTRDWECAKKIHFN